MKDENSTSKNFTFGKEEKLKSRKLINDLFQSGSVVKSYPIRIHYMVYEESGEHYIKTGVSVSKRNFKRAVDRNRIKRQLREAYRLKGIKLKKYLSDNSLQLCMMIIYIDRKHPETKHITSKMTKCLDKIVLNLSSDK